MIYLISTLQFLFQFRYSQFNQPELLQFASIAGLGGIDFILSWGGAIGAYILYTFIDYQRRNSFLSRIYSPVVVYLVVLSLIYTYGSIRLAVAETPFYQRSMRTYIPKSLTRVGCVLGKVFNGTTDETNAYLVDETRKLAESGSQIVIWSEGAAAVFNEEEKHALFNAVRDLSVTYNTYIAFSYIDHAEQYNKVTLVSSEGEVVIDYIKAHPVIGVEKVRAGPDELKTVDTKFGVVGVAVCFDYNFPRLIRQASKKKVDLMLQPSSTWVSIGISNMSIYI